MHFANFLCKGDRETRVIGGTIPIFAELVWAAN
jgi:hypothetical protein